MTEPALPQVSFAAGEVSPKLYQRVDQSFYRIACRKLRNFFVHPGGGAVSRAGTEFVAEVNDSSVRGRLIPFQFNDLVTYVLEFGDQIMRVIKNGGIVVTGNTQQVTNSDFTTDINGWTPIITDASTIVWDSLGGGSVKITSAGQMAILRQVIGGIIAGQRYTIDISRLTTAGANNAVYVGTFPGANDILNFPINSSNPLTTELTFIAPTTPLYIELRGQGQFWVDQASIIGPLDGAPYTVASPYSIGDLAELKYTQSADTMTFTHPKYPPYDLTRTGDAAWTFTPVTFQPSITYPTSVAASGSAGSVVNRYRVTAVNAQGTEESLAGLNTAGALAITGVTKANPAVVTCTNTLQNGDEIQIDSVGGMTQLNGNRYLIANRTGTTFELRDTSNNNIDSTNFGTYTAGGTATPDFVRVTLAAPTLAAPITITWANQAGVSQFNVYKDSNGVFGQIGSATGTSFADTNIAADVTTSPPGGRNPFANANYPSCVAYHDQRKFFANSTSQPQTLWATQTGNFKNMNVSSPTQATDAITRTLVSQKVSAIRHMVSVNVLILLTSNAEWKVFPGSNNDSLQPDQCYTKPQSYNGCADQPAPIVANQTILFVEKNGNAVRDINYDFTTDTYSGSDRSILSEHLLKNHTIAEWAYANSPYRIIWAIRDDGALLGFTYMREQQVYAWHYHDTDGTFESVAVITENGVDTPYFIVNRTINGFTKRYIERMKPRDPTDWTDHWGVDCGLRYNGTPVTGLSGAGYLEGKTVSIFADGSVMTPQKVVNGAITLEAAASKVLIGLPFTPLLETLDLQAEPTIQHKRKRVSDVHVYVENTKGLAVGAVKRDGTYGRARDAKERRREMYGTAVAPKTEMQEINTGNDVALNPHGRVYAIQNYPLPATILAIVPEVYLGD